MQQRYAAHQPGKTSVKRLERYSRAETAAEKAGQEIKSLARFVSAQKLAFVKILKKYRKWTGSSTLESRFRSKVLDQPTAFSKRNFDSLLAQYTEVLAAVRAPFEPGQDAVREQKSFVDRYTAPKGSAPSSQGSRTRKDLPTAHATGKQKNNTAAELHVACQDRSSIELDTILAMSPIGSSGGKTSYWVHPDNLVELHVLLLQYTRLWRANGSKVATSTNGLRQEHRRELENETCIFTIDGRGDEAGLIVCDDLDEFSRRKSSAPISGSEEFAGRFLDEAAATARYLPTGDAVLAVNILRNDDSEPRTPGAFQSVLMRREAVRHLFDADPSNNKIEQFLWEENSQNGQTFRVIREWLTIHQEVQPLVQLQHKRTRFVGLQNTDQAGMWATLDRDIMMKATPRGFFTSKDADLAFGGPEDSGFATFPFVVLEVRFEGGSETEFLSVLDKTHLVIRDMWERERRDLFADRYRPRGFEVSQLRLML